MRRVFVPLICALLTLAALGCATAQEGGPPLPAGTRAPAFTVKTISGRPISLRSLRGHVVLLDYWATWCGPCQMATPTLQALHKQFSRRGLRVVGISVDDAHTVGMVKPFMKHFGMTYAVCAGPEADQKAATAYNTQGIPSQYLIDKKGVVRWSQSGYSPDEKAQLSALIQKLLAEKR